MDWPFLIIDSYPKTFKNPNCVPCCYKKSKEDKHRLVIKPEEAKAVREIFNMKIAGTGTTLVARALNDRGIPYPTELYRSRGGRTQDSGKTKAIRVTGRQQRLKSLYGTKSIQGQWYG